ncbi:hypothetical protein PAMP_024678 [Pampus punctatissimus]
MPVKRHQPASIDTHRSTVSTKLYLIYFIHSLFCLLPNTSYDQPHQCFKLWDSVTSSYREKLFHFAFSPALVDTMQFPLPTCSQVLLSLHFSIQYITNHELAVSHTDH